MKKVFVMTVLFVAMISVATAQQRRTPPSAEERAKNLTERLDKTIGLTEDQKTKIQAVNLDLTKKSSEIIRNNEGDRDALRAKLQEINTERDTKYKALLTEEQFKKYSDEKAAREKERQERQGQRQGQRQRN